MTHIEHMRDARIAIFKIVRAGVKTPLAACVVLLMSIAMANSPLAANMQFEEGNGSTHNRQSGDQPDFHDKAPAPAAAVCCDLAVGQCSSPNLPSAGIGIAMARREIGKVLFWEARLLRGRQLDVEVPPPRV